MTKPHPQSSHASSPGKADQPKHAADNHTREKWKSADRQQRKALIVQVAMDLLACHGLDGVTMRRVAGRLGVGAMTLYTYIAGQDELRKEMIRCGVHLLNAQCDPAAIPPPAEHPPQQDPSSACTWQQGASLYIRFAMANPNLYRLMFNEPGIASDELDLLRGGFDSWCEEVRQDLQNQGLQGTTLDQQAREQAGRFWVAVHGLASLAIDGRLSVIGLDWEKLLTDLTQRISPTA